jgi:hypothetical protein
VVRWLSENSISGSKRLAIETDKIIYRPGEPIQLTAVAYDDAYRQTTDYRLVAGLKVKESNESAAAATEVSPLADQQAYRVELPAMPPASVISNDDAGAFSTLQTAQLEVIASDAGREIARTSAEIQLLYDSPELQRPQPAPENLTRLANGSGGRVLANARELESLLRQFPATPGEVIVYRTPMWDKTWLWFALLGLLGFEWSMRRRSGFG